MPMVELLASHGALSADTTNELQTTLRRIAMKWEHTALSLPTTSPSFVGSR